MITRKNFEYLWKDPLFSKPMTLSKLRRILTIGLSEMTGTCIFISMGCSSIAKNKDTLPEPSFFAIVLAFIFAIGLAVLVTNHISGSILNPSLVAAMVILGHFSLYRFLLYTVSQLIGGYLAVGLNWVLVPDLPNSYCVLKRENGVSELTSFVYEFIGSSLLCFALCALVDKRRIGSIKHVAIKFMFVLFPIILNLSKLFSTSTNPARTFGGAAVALDFEDFWIFFCGPYVGASTMATIYRLFFNDSIEEKAEARTIINVVE